MTSTGGSEIAIIGMAGRFPGSSELEGFWDNLLYPAPEDLPAARRQLRRTAGAPARWERRRPACPWSDQEVGVRDRQAG